MFVFCFFVVLINNVASRSTFRSTVCRSIFSRNVLTVYFMGMFIVFRMFDIVVLFDVVVFGV